LTVEKILAKVAELLDKIGVLPEGGILPETALAGEGGLEPLDLVKLIMACEQEFKIIIHDEDVYRLKRIGDIVAYIDGRLEEGTADLALHDEAQRVAW
jgi:acyl carrier protein